MHIPKLREISSRIFRKSFVSCRFQTNSRILLYSVHFLGGEFSSCPFGDRFPGRNHMILAEVSNAATRYSSLEADEFDEGSAAEEADASVTQIAEVVASKGEGGNDFV